MIWLSTLDCYYATTATFYIDDGNTTQVVQTHIFHFPQTLSLLQKGESPPSSILLLSSALLFAYYISVISFTTPASATLMDCMRFLQSFAQQ